MRPAHRLACLAVSCLLLSGQVAQASAELPPDKPVPLLLDVSLNGQDTHQIASFQRYANGQLALRRADASDLGLKVPPGDDAFVLLNALPGVSYTFDFARQTVDILLPDSARNATVIAAKPPAPVPKPQRPWGAYLNYSAYVAGNYESHVSDATGLASLLADANFFGPFGTFEQSQLLTAGFDGSDTRFIVLDTQWSYADPETLSVYNAGDVISGSLSWSHSVRLAGVQWQRNFALRPDLVTLPLPAFSGSAAVPSTVDVYLDNTKAFSTQVPGGPFSLNDIPIVSGGGTARVVVTDTTGRTVETTGSFFTDEHLLAEGLYDYSVEVGFPRFFYGQKSAFYDSNVAGSGTARYGLTDSITVETHVEASESLFSGGVGARLNAGFLGLVSAAAAFSRTDTKSGNLFYGAIDLPTGDFNFHASTQRTTGTFVDLASLTPDKSGIVVSNTFPRAVDEFSISYIFAESHASFSLSGVHALQQGTESSVLTGSVNVSFDNGMTLFGTAFRDLQHASTYGAFIGLFMPLGERSSVSVGATSNSSGSSLSAEYDFTPTLEPGSTGTRLAVNLGSNSSINAYQSLRLDEGLLEGTLLHNGDSTSASVSFSGSLIAAGGGVFVAPKVEGAFAVANVGQPNVRVMKDNQVVGTTDSSGQVIVPNLLPYQDNRLSIDNADLPVDADAPKPTLTVVPAERSGAVAEFNVRTRPPSAQVIFTLADQSFALPGTRGHLNGNSSTFVVGYDGRAFIVGLNGRNEAILETESGSCRATFDYSPTAIGFALIGPVTCR